MSGISLITEPKHKEQKIMKVNEIEQSMMIMMLTQNITAGAGVSFET